LLAPPIADGDDVAYAFAAVDFDIGKRTASQKQSGKKRGQGSLLDAGNILAKLISSTGAR
jgi:hypothetical protein